MFLFDIKNVQLTGEANEKLINKQSSSGSSPKNPDLLLKEQILNSEEVDTETIKHQPPELVVDINDYYKALFSFCGADLDYNNKIDKKDREILVKIIMGEIHPGDPITLQPIRPIGDLNNDGKVDNKDLEMFDTTLKAGDMNHDDKVNKQDLQILDQLVFKNQEGDINKDGIIDLADHYPLLNFLSVANVAWSNKTEVDKEDREMLIKLIEEGLGPKPGVRNNGDLNSDGKVDNEDLKIFDSVFKAGDINHDGKVDMEDCAINFDRISLDLWWWTEVPD